MWRGKLVVAESERGAEAGWYCWRDIEWEDGAGGPKLLKKPDFLYFPVNCGVFFKEYKIPLQNLPEALKPVHTCGEVAT
ncbi:hypothetical protein L7F22_063576 [Adiantum nelumboides]|nr:hypothetical protein [Adiantum nelumboides]